MEPYDVRDLLTLVSIPRLGPVRIRALLEHFHDPSSVLSASPRALIRVRGIDRTTALHIARAAGDFADDQIRRAARTGSLIIPFNDPRYPEALRSIYDPPVLLFMTGHVAEEDRISLAIVGTRSPSPYGQRVAEEMARLAVGSSVAVVSGLARGIDTVAHRASLEAGGRTIAVLGSGLDVPYPSENARLMREISTRGAVVTEFPFGTKPDATNFPRRNRIVSGMTLGTLVIESALDGGAMITAASALDQGREVFAVPGSIHAERSAGTHALIRDGRAKLVACFDDVLAELRMAPKGDLPIQPCLIPELAPTERMIFDHVTSDPVHIDELAERSSLGPADALVALLGLEFKGLVRQLPGKWFVRI
ncbi:MAG: DNA-processing protein DprA [Bacteroidetes bacterium]|jgi:DNA processing protein|nr:DNA-processing protein DprA [Bacteroidota bacterium]